jgi:hypothetical protein
LPFFHLQILAVPSRLEVTTNLPLGLKEAPFSQSS